MGYEVESRSRWSPNKRHCAPARTEVPPGYSARTHFSETRAGSAPAFTPGPDWLRLPRGGGKVVGTRVVGGAGTDPSLQPVAVVEGGLRA